MEKAAFLSVIYGACMVLAFFATTGHTDGSSFRLPNETLPDHYILRLDTAIDQNIFNYTGNVQIGFWIIQPTFQIVLHSTRSSILKIELRDKNGIQVQIKNYRPDIVREFLVIETATILERIFGPYTIEIDFTNSVDRADSAGFYKLSYLTENDTVRNIGVTDFEAINARSAFPCFDEPDLRATFELHISCGLTYHVRSNTPVQTVQRLPGGSKQLYSFTKTPRMPTYLLAWLVSDFVRESQVLDRSRVTVSTWAKPTSAHLLSYSVNASVRFLRVMEQYFAQRYTLPKIDNIALPRMKFAAMENWGMVTYLENMLFFNPQKDDARKQGLVVQIIAHEYTHQIFGNLLTPMWWDSLWLKEGFAEFYSYHLGQISHPEHNLRKRFITDSMLLAFYQDARANARPMTYYVEKRQDIESLYDGVVYSKAACVIRMMQYALGERIFRDGIRHYIQRNKRHGMVMENDLFDSLDLVAKKEYALPKNVTMHEVFRSWSHQAGYPVVSVRREGDKYFFTQQRYVSSLSSVHKSLNSSWWIPISFSTANKTAYETLPAFWMAPNVSQVSYTIPTPPQAVVVFNPQATGFYRVAYEDTMLRGIIQQLANNHTAIVPAARARLIDDTLHLAHTRGSNFSAVLQLLAYLRQEADILPWKIAHENLRYMQSLLRTDAKATQLLQSFIEVIAAPLLSRHDVQHRSNFGSDSIDELQSIAVELACGASESCKKASQSILHIAAHNASTRFGVSDSVLLCYGLQQSNVQHREAYLKQMSHGLKENLGCLGSAIKRKRSYAHYLFHLDETRYSNELHRLIVGSKVSPSDLLESIEIELSQRQRKTNDQPAITKLLIAISRFAMEPLEEKLLTTVASTYASEIVLEIERQLKINRQWRARNVQPLTEALTSFLLQRKTQF